MAFTLPARREYSDSSNLARTAGFSLYAGFAAKAHQRRKLERLCRYIARPAVATDRLALTPQSTAKTHPASSDVWRFSA